MNGQNNGKDFGAGLFEALLGSTANAPGKLAGHVLEIDAGQVQDFVVELATKTINALETELRVSVAELQRERLFSDLLISALHHDQPGFAKYLGRVRADMRKQGRFQVVTVLRDLARASDSEGMTWDELRAHVKDACAKLAAEEAPSE